jgi:hypothetical protein
VVVLVLVLVGERCRRVEREFHRAGGGGGGGGGIQHPSTTHPPPLSFHRLAHTSTHPHIHTHTSSPPLTHHYESISSPTTPNYK